MSLVCTNIPIDKSLPFIILLKRKDTYEVIITIDEEKEITWKYTDKSSIIKFMLDYKEASCVRENVLPSKYRYKEMLSLNEMLSKIGKDKIKSQLINVFGKVNFLITTSDIMIPIKESGVNATLKQTSSPSMLTVQDYIQFLPSIQTVIPDYKYIGATINSSNKVNGLMSIYGQIIPVQPSDIKDIREHDIKVLSIKFYPDAEEMIVKQTFDKNNEVLYNEDIAFMKDTIYKIKVLLADYISKDQTQLKEKFMYLITKPKIQREEKIKRITKVFKKILQRIQKTSPQLVLQHIANELLNDNREYLLLNNIVVSDVFNPNEVVQRETESVLLNLVDIHKWVKKYAK
jgi:hypothetical protein